VSWGDERLDRLNDFMANDPLYARLNLSQLFDGQNFGDVKGVINVSKVFRWCSNPRC
jgi:hypothetical protein